MRRILVPLLALLLCAPALAHARVSSGGTGFGPQIGMSSDPDQLVLGVHLAFRDVAPQLDFVPGVEVGFGDDVTVTALNGDFHYRFLVSGSSWRPYVGAGVSFYDVSGTGSFEAGHDTFGGGNLIVGAEAPTRGGNRFGAELRLGLGDSPTVKLSAGWTFPMR